MTKRSAIYGRHTCPEYRESFHVVGHRIEKGLRMTKRAYGLAGLALFLLAVLIAQRSCGL